jgi:hypothetical protein
MDTNNFSIVCTGDACVGDEVCFKKSIFSGTYPKCTFIGTEEIQGTIVKESYGKIKQQHTFTLMLPNGAKMLIKGRNLYRNGCNRKPWQDELLRSSVLDEKHTRGLDARNKASIRKSTIFI